jgi:hypothetical protein
MEKQNRSQVAGSTQKYTIDVTIRQFKKLPAVLQQAVGNAVLRQLDQDGFRLGLLAHTSHQFARTEHIPNESDDMDCVDFLKVLMVKGVPADPPSASEIPEGFHEVDTNRNPCFIM